MKHLLLLIAFWAPFQKSYSQHLVNEIVIRGNSNCMSEEDLPLYIVDGKWVERKELEKIDPKTIDSIIILKKENHMSCYGTKNTVLIKTKKHSKSECKKMKR